MDNMDMLRLEVGSKLVEIEDLLKDWNLPTVTGVTLVARDPDNPTGLHVVLTNGGDAEIDGAIELLRASRNGHTDAAPGEALDWPSDDVIAEVLERAELGRELIALAAKEPTIWNGIKMKRMCVFCKTYSGKHRDDCLYLRARALRGDDE